ncbi:hypothetical protein K0U00_44770, partial [Paenibacillus sepulcri]|nr:hypothetical protein [Paenibacillus sepulcri]
MPCYKGWRKCKVAEAKQYASQQELEQEPGARVELTKEEQAAEQERILKRITAELSLPGSKVKAAVNLLDEGNTIPFIARYRKEMTGELDETELRS